VPCAGRCVSAVCAILLALLSLSFHIDREFDVGGLKSCSQASLSPWHGINDNVAELGGRLSSCLVNMSSEGCKWAFDGRGWGHGWQSFCKDPCTVLCSPDQADFFQNHTLRIRTPVTDGFWVRALMVLSQIFFATQMGIQTVTIEPHVDAKCGNPQETCTHEVAVSLEECVDQEYCDVYIEDGNGWTEFWEPVNALNITNRSAGAIVTESRVVELHYNFAWLLYFQFFHYPSSYTQAQEIRLKMAAMVGHYVKVRQRVMWLVDENWLRMTKGEAQPVLGVHIRGTDKYIGQRHPPRVYFPLIDAYLTAFSNAVIFLATDDDEYARIMTNRYRKQLVQQQSEHLHVRRGSDRTAIWRQGSNASAHLGTQVLVDSLLLARCTFLLKSNSAVSEFAIFFNTDLINQSFDYAIHDNPIPSWATLS